MPNPGSIVMCLSKQSVARDSNPPYVRLNETKVNHGGRATAGVHCKEAISPDSIIQSHVAPIDVIESIKVDESG